MRKMILIFTLLIIAGCSGEQAVFKGIQTATIPQSCADYKNDVCGLFDCMVEMCWCDDSGPDLPIIYEKEGASISSEDEAAALVSEFVESTDLEYKEYTNIVNVVALNTVFFNVFAENPSGDEMVFTVAADGTVVKTVCGV